MEISEAEKQTLLCEDWETCKPFVKAEDHTDFEKFSYGWEAGFKTAIELINSEKAEN